MKKAVPTLDSGFVTSEKAIMKQLFINMFFTNKSQSNMFRDSIISIPMILAEQQRDMATTIRTLTTEIRNYYLRFFDDVEVNITERPADLTNPNGPKVILDLSISTHKDGAGYDLHSAILAEATKSAEYALEHLRQS